MEHKSWTSIILGAAAPGAAGTASTFALGYLNTALGCIAGALTIILVAMKIRREWRHRND